jgi:hypothetical protein
MRRFVLSVAVLCCQAAGAWAQTTETFMNTVLTCAGGLNVSIDARLLGSVRSIYEGDRTQGTAYLRSETTFLSKIPEADRVRALQLYHDCIKSILQTQHQITQEVLTFRLWVNIPTDMRIWLANNGIEEDALLQRGHFFSRLLDQVSVGYRLMRDPCRWTTIQDYESNYGFYYYHAVNGELFPDNISVSAKLWAERFSTGSYFFGANDVRNFTFKNEQPTSPLRSVDSLVGKCLYVELSASGLRFLSETTRPDVRQLILRFGTETLQSTRLTHFRVNLTPLLGVELRNSAEKKVYHSRTRIIWQIDLPKTVEGFRL